MTKWLFTAETVDTTAAPEPTTALPNMALYLAGCRIDKLDNTTLLLQPGTFASANGTAVHRIPVETPIDLTVHGAGGRDTAAAFADGDELFVYLIGSTDTGAVTAVASRARFYSDVAVPAGFTLLRKLPVGYKYNAARWGGPPNHHLSGWPSPVVHYTDFETNSIWRALSAGTATVWTPADLSAFIPDNARMAYVQYRVEATGAAGSAYLRSHSIGGKLLDSATVGDGVARHGFTWQRVTSTLAVEYQVTGGARLSLWVAGYAQTEHS